MGHLDEQKYIQPLTAKKMATRRNVTVRRRCVALAALAPTWTVEREIGPLGDLTIIVLPAGYGSARSAFVLYENNGCVQFGTIKGEIWQSKCAFPTCQRAVAAIIATATLST